MTSLVTSPNLSAPDDVYSDLIHAHDGLTDAESEALNARLILVLANHIGDREIIRQALEVASQSDPQAIT